tara:strand:- start:157 stop:729 length:573 start_codon:yes stop_codon:yes gene_type:complete
MEDNKMGRRIGLARTEALIENLKREIQVNESRIVGVKRKAITLTNAATTARTLLATESGAYVTLDPSTDDTTTITVTMPEPAAGLYFDFLIINDQVNAAADIILQTTANGCDFEGAILCSDGAAGIQETTASTSKITIDATNVKTVFGTQVSALCDGTDWYLRITHPQDGKDCVAGSAGAGVQFVLTATL